MIFLLLLPLFGIVSSVEASQKKLYNNYSVLRAEPSDEDQCKFLRKLSSDRKIEFLRGPYFPGYASDILVPPELRRNVEDELTAEGIQYSTLLDDLQEVLVRTTREASYSGKLNDSDPNHFFYKYHTFNEIQKFLTKLKKKYGRISALETIGRTHYKRALRIIKIGMGGKKPKPAIWIDAGIHAREWISTSTALYITVQLLTKYKSDKIVKRLVNKFNWYILPVVNPDGYAYSQKYNRMWRKNRSPIPNSDQVGVDLNRNFGYGWGTAEDNEDEWSPYSETYQGPSAFSEFESSAIKDFLSPRNQSLLVFLSLHSYGKLWLTPFGYKRRVPVNYKEMRTLAEIGNKAMSSYRGNTYEIIPAHELYLTTGTSLDWAHGALKVRYSYVMELGERAFRPPTKEIPQIGEEVWRAVKEVALHLTRKKNGTVDREV